MMRLLRLQAAGQEPEVLHDTTKPQVLMMIAKIVLRHIAEHRLNSRKWAFV